MICNMDCENCKEPDCINDKLTDIEVEQSISLDTTISSENSHEGSYRKQYYWKNREKCKQWAKETYERNKEKQNARCREYYKNNREKCNALNRRWRAEHPELMKIKRHEYYVRWRDKKKALELSNGS